MVVAIATAAGALLLTLGAWRLPCSIGEKFLIWMIGFWTACIVAGNVLSPFAMLGNDAAYAAALVFSCAAMATAFSWWKSCPDREVRPNPLLDFVPKNPWLRGAGFAGAVAVLAGLVCLNVWIALTISPTNPDSQMYRLARIYFYASQGSLFHFAQGIDGRMLYYPLNGALLLMPIAVGGWPVHVFTLAFVLVWMTVGVLVFEFCRSLGCSAFVSIWTVVLVVSSPILLAMATSTNDEIFAGCGLLAAAYFFWRYLQTRTSPMLALSGLAAGCSFGTKLQFFYLWPVGLLFVGVLLGRLCSASGIRRGKEILRGGFLWGIPAVVLSAPFLVYSFLSTSRFFDPALAGIASNAPFDLRFAMQNLFLHSAELLASPFFELFRWMNADAQATLLARVNAGFVQVVSPYLLLQDRFFLGGESLKGVWGVNSVRPTEDTEWIGFLWLAFAFCGWLAFRKRREIPAIFLWLPSAAGLWWISFCFSVRYFGPMGVHLAYGAILAAPVLCLLFAWLRSALARLIRAGIVGLCLMVNSVSAYALFTINPYRNLTRDETPRRLGRERLARELADFKHIRILVTHWGMPYLEVISAVPGKTFQVVTRGEPFSDPRDKTIELYCFPRLAPLGKLPIKIPDSVAGLRLLSEVQPTKGTEYIFGRGMKKDSTPVYAILDATIEIRPERCRLALAGKRWPEIEESLEFRISFFQKGKLLSVSDWSQRPFLDESFSGRLVRQTQMSVEVRRAGSPASVVTSTLFPFKIKGPDLWAK